MKGLFELLLGLGLILVTSSYSLRTKEHPISLDVSDTEKLVGEDGIMDYDQVQQPSTKKAIIDTEQDEGQVDDVEQNENS